MLVLNAVRNKLIHRVCSVVHRQQKYDKIIPSRLHKPWKSVRVYRLMNETKLLLGKVIRPTGKREFVKFKRIEATKPLEYL